MEFPIIIGDKKLTFDSSLVGVMVSGKEFIATKDSPLIYDQIKDRHETQLRLQMSSNTSTLIPALKVLGVPYPVYFDQEDVVKSQNDITFYWKKSQLAAYYNRYSTDNMLYPERKQVIKEAVAFIVNSGSLDLPEEYLTKLNEPCKLLGFYAGFPIFDSSTGMAKLLSRLGIHVGPESIMISTPLDEHATLVYDTATAIGSALKIQGVYKKNRVTFSDKKLVLDFLMKGALGKSEG
ncbi:hypothetical protein CO112_00565 [Candidatus Dojkabacteria bacterium CG_4_9_14_3_um_filter_150_Dojkabacteria_WS6_41_13]|uniref:Uncharacterized protein n=1 Tax=Candidatus Dojkabacteria bacterium CG_4_10_14_0_2_um_filter_Dojkabacteria_WS6_41_15 TaxID=2014249 RepID=A0A2M7W339_9BACT|nr:MAG: hypothetical protein COX64_00480 [Candidatus Dojkabacteria bacterium CG_4_10_14_0_2_um_filter_Dojkabacteria_WS6_41_15]PJB23553.1 MAG: hypothetical protein CO112_00565 [Candidatus Dojkabacteria bacterium CG_4_9_14_3_um_filter_150_Dojkabacteria_WS6_41_13]